VLSSQPTSKELTVKIKRYQIILIGLAMLGAFGLLGSMDKEEEERQQAEYCEMVKLWKQTNGRAGWPAYNGEGACR